MTAIAETILQEWKQKDPFLLDVDGFQRFCNERQPQLLKKMEKEAEAQMQLLVRVFTAPTIAWKGPWMDTIPDWLLNWIKMDRFIALIKNEYNETATDSEALAYIIPRAMENPMDHEWGRIYLYLGTKVMREAKQVEVPADVAVDSLDDYEQGLLRKLKRWIWEKQEEALKQRRRKEKALGTSHV